MRNKGQILLDSPMGQWIYNLAKSSEVNSIVEVGTWRGMGSTYCIIQGLLARDTPIREGYSVECDYDKYQEACRNLKPLPENFFLLYGSIISYAELKFLEDKVEGAIHKKWFETDLKKIKEAPFIGDVMETQVIDLCVLDGGEFTGLVDFFYVGIHSKFVVLDDTDVLKHKQTRSYILSNNDWEVLADEPAERNGYMICRNKKY